MYLGRQYTINGVVYTLTRLFKDGAAAFQAGNTTLVLQSHELDFAFLQS